MKSSRDREKGSREQYFPSNIDLSHLQICSQYTVPKPSPNTIKIFIKTKAGGNRTVRKANQSADWRVGQSKKWGEGSTSNATGGAPVVWAGGEALHPPLPPTLSVKDPHSPLPSHIHPGGQPEPCSDPSWGEGPSHPPMAVSQSVCLPPFPNK